MYSVYEITRAHLSAPAVANNGPLLNAVLLTQLIHNLGDTRQSLRGCSLCLEELAHLLLLFIVVWWHPGNVGWAALEKVGHENLVLLTVCVGEDVGSLQGLVEEAKDVVYY